MLITVLKDGTGSGGGAAAYFVGLLDSRGLVRDRMVVHRGDPVQVAAVIDCIDQFVHRYTSIVVNFGADHPTPLQISAVLEDLQCLVYAGVEPRHRCSLAVEHGKRVDGAMAIDLHLLVPRVDLKTGSSYNALPPGWERAVGYLTDAWNFEVGWVRGLDPLRLRPQRRRKKTRGGAEEGVSGNLVDMERARRARLAYDSEVARRAEAYRRMTATPRQRYARLKAPAPASSEAEHTAAQALLGAAGASASGSLLAFLSAPALSSTPVTTLAPLDHHISENLHDRDRTPAPSGPGAAQPSECGFGPAGAGWPGTAGVGAGLAADLDSANRRRDAAVERLGGATRRRQHALDAIGAVIGALAHRMAHVVEQALKRLSLRAARQARRYLDQLHKPDDSRPDAK